MFNLDHVCYFSVLGSGGGTGYPGVLDTAETQVDSPSPSATVIDAANFNDLAAAIIALQTELGVDPAGSATDLKTRLGVQHNADGTHSDITADTISATSTISATGNISGADFLIGGVSIALPTGMTVPYIGTSAPAGWVIGQGGTIGNASSGGSARAHADTESLFTLLWNSMADAQAPVSSGRGASAAADFAANKTITLPDLRGAAVFGTGGTAPATHGDNGGAETHTLTVSEMPSHTHVVGQNKQAPQNVAGSGYRGFDTVSGDSASAGGDGAHNNMPPWVALNYIIKL